MSTATALESAPAAAAAPAADTGSEVLLRLRGGIASGRLAAGQALIETELARWLAVSRPTVREGLRRLEAEGLATRSRARGLAVRRLTRRDVEELYEIREVLEALAARRAAERIAAGERQHDAALAEQRTLWQRVSRSGELLAFSEANRRLHALVLAAAGNAHLPTLLDRTLMDLFAAQLRGWIAAPKIVQSARQHLALVETLQAGDARAAERLMRAHVRASAETVLALPDDAF
jgi:DNA-binding GntR family transcriptional regulator